MTNNKFQIVECNAQNLECNILATFWEYAEAASFLNKHVAESFDLGINHKCFHENPNTLSVYKYHYVFPKEIVKKFHIIQFEDVPEE